MTTTTTMLLCEGDNVVVIVVVVVALSRRRCRVIGHARTRGQVSEGASDCRDPPYPAEVLRVRKRQYTACCTVASVPFHQGGRARATVREDKGGEDNGAMYTIVHVVLTLPYPLAKGSGSGRGQGQGRAKAREGMGEGEGEAALASWSL